MSHASLCNPDLRVEPPVTPSLVDRDEEVWAVIESYPSNLVSSHGRVWSAAHRRLRSTRRMDRYYVALSKSQGGNFLLHRVVAAAFVPGQFKRAVVNHKDGLKNNNIWTNLEWVTQQRNNQHAREMGLNPLKLTDQQVDDLRRQVAESKRPFKDIAEEFGTTSQYVGYLCSGQGRGGPAIDTHHRPRRGKLSQQEAEEVVRLLQERELTYKVIAERFKVSAGNIANLAAGRVWSKLTKGMNLTEGRDTWDMRRKNGTDTWSQKK